MGWQFRLLHDLVDECGIGTNGLKYARLGRIELEFSRVADLSSIFLLIRFDKRSECVENIFYRFHQNCPIAQERMAALRVTVIDRSGDCEHISILFHGLAGGDQGSAPLGGLDNQRAERQTRDNSISSRKGVAVATY